MLTGRIFSQRLDRSKPLWELWLVQGLEGGRFAIINKTHHALVDGVSGVDITTVLFDTSPTPTPIAPESWTPAVEPCDATLVAEGVKGIAGLPTRVARRALDAARRPRETAASVREAGEGLGNIAWNFANPAPETPLNVPIGPHRRVLWLDVSARGAQGDQERARGDGQRRLPGGGVGGARPLAAPPWSAHRGAGAARDRPGLDPGRRAEGGAGQPDHRDAGAVAGLRAGPGGALPHRVGVDERT